MAVGFLLCNTGKAQSIQSLSQEDTLGIPVCGDLIAFREARQTGYRNYKNGMPSDLLEQEDWNPAAVVQCGSFTVYYQDIQDGIDGGFDHLTLGEAVNPGERAVVYPNPADAQIFVKPPINKSVVSRSLFDATGKQVANGRRIAGSGIDISALTPGLYLLRIAFADGGVESHKVEIAK